MPTLVTNREGENCGASIYGSVLELQPRLYTSAGYSNKFWSVAAGFRHTVPGTQYLVRCPLANSQKTQLKNAYLVVSHDGKDVTDPSKSWVYTSGNTTSGFREWPVVSQSDTLDISIGLPATWGLLDNVLMSRWLPYARETAASVGTDFEVDRTPSEIDQNGIVIPEQIQRLYAFGNPVPAYRILFITGLHSPEHAGSRGYMNAIDVLLEEYPDLLDQCKFICSHTLCPGRWAGHNRGYAVGAGSWNPNRQWGDYHPTTPFVSSMEDALKRESIGGIRFDFSIDFHSRYNGPRIYHVPNYGPSLDFEQYVSSSLWEQVPAMFQNGTQNATVEQWGGVCGLTLEWAGGTVMNTDATYRQDARVFLDALRTAIADGYLDRVGLPPQLIIDNADPQVSRNGKWFESVAPNPYNGTSEYCGNGPTDGCFGTLQWPVTVTGEHYVEIWFTHHPNRSDSVKYEVDDRNGLYSDYLVDQSDAANGGRWIRLGLHDFDGGGFVRVDCRNGQASADAVRLVPVSGEPCDCTNLVQPVMILQDQAAELLAETGSEIAADMVDNLATLRARLDD